VTEDSNDAVSDAGSDHDTVDLFDPSQETLADRFYALRDMVKPSTRRSIASAWASSSVYAKKGIKGAGLVAWWVSTSVILLGLPLALAVESESQYAQQEKYEREAQQGAQQVRLRWLCLRR
jgi:import receptor subunit TOM22